MGASAHMGGRRKAGSIKMAAGRRGGSSKMAAGRRGGSRMMAAGRKGGSIHLGAGRKGGFKNPFKKHKMKVGASSFMSKKKRQSFLKALKRM